MNKSTSSGKEPPSPRNQSFINPHKVHTTSRKPKKHRRLRVFGRSLSWFYGRSGEGSKATVPGPRPEVTSPAGIPGRTPMQTRAQVSDDPGDSPRFGGGEASRVPRPCRSGASACSVRGRSATRPDSQRRHWRTSRPGQAAWGWRPELPEALPRMNQSMRRLREGEQRE